jgi:hypothetical protein
MNSRTSGSSIAPTLFPAAFAVRLWVHCLLRHNKSTSGGASFVRREGLPLPIHSLDVFMYGLSGVDALIVFLNRTVAKMDGDPRGERFQGRCPAADDHMLPGDLGRSDDLRNGDSQRGAHQIQR